MAGGRDQAMGGVGRDQAMGGKGRDQAMGGVSRDQTMGGGRQGPDNGWRETGTKLHLLSDVNTMILHVRQLEVYYSYICLVPVDILQTVGYFAVLCGGFL